MAIEYFCCYHSYRRKIAKLSDQEVGRLFRSLLEYSETGETQELAGREAVAFDFIADDIDRAKESYDSKCRQLQANASKSRQKQADAGKCMQMQADASISGENKYKDKYKDEEEKEQEEKETPPPKDEPEFPPVLQEAVDEWLKYKSERREAYKPTGLRNLKSEIRRQASMHGEEAVAGLIRLCMASNWRGIIFDRLGGDKQEKPSKTEAKEENPEEELARIKRIYARMSGGDG